ncbi:MAG TPA: cyclic nucleotide-binding domain-containing protein [Anaeromyxobacteraceae bacterium]|nr:cyclic nucleotide-binding domain-containing protein [Anaeromyxobacteraceae bacterium]
MRPEERRTLPEDRRFGPVERVLMLKRIPSFAALSPADLAALAEHGRERFWPRGATLLRSGAPVDAAHLVFEGRIRLWRRGRAVGVAEPGASIGATLLLAREEAGLEAVAETDAVTLALEREAYLDALEERFEVLRTVLRETCRELVDLLVRNPLEAAPAPTVPPVRPPRPDADRPLELVERILLLRGTRPFELCGVGALAELAQRLEEVRVPAGTTLWRRGDRTERMLILADGRVRAEPPGGSPPFQVGPGQAFGALEVLAEVPRWYDAFVEEPVTALVADGTQILDLFEDDVAVGIELLADLARSSVRVQERIAGRAGRVPALFACEGRCG